ncbi:MAG: protein kinase [Desulfotignum sp.]|nr:protein kinase [Desulfotignum sp.]
MKKIGRFTITGLLGKGGMGRVYKIAYPVTKKIAALKLLEPSSLLAGLTPEKALEEMFTKEAVTMAAIRHPHVVDILDFGRTGNQLYYIMDYFCNNLGTLMGESFEEDDTRVVPIEKAVPYTTQILRGLVCLHFSGIIHRDIKPANMLITDLDTVKICDFGLSLRQGERLKRHGSIRVGSPYYAAPEQEADPDNVDVTADLYAVGIMLYKMLTGRLPQKSGSPASQMNPDLDVSWDRFFAKALDPDPAGRFPGADTMCRDLEGLARAWKTKKEQICSMPAELEQKNDHVPKKAQQPKAGPAASGREKSDGQGSGHPASDIKKPAPVRAVPGKIPLNKARAFFDLDRFMQPRRYIANDFFVPSDGLVHDRHTGLVWQQSGTWFPVTWFQAKTYVKQLNFRQFGGYTAWRLPTIHELLTLAVPPAKGRDHCISPIFDAEQKWLWGADKSTFVSAWYMNLEMGFVGRNDFTGFYHVKAVCSAF